MIPNRFHFGHQSSDPKQIAIGGLGGILNDYQAEGVFSFAATAGFTGYAPADFFIGKFASMLQAVGEFKQTRFIIFDLFANDSIAVSGRLRLDLGIRWEPFFPYRHGSR